MTACSLVSCQDSGKGPSPWIPARKTHRTGRAYRDEHEGAKNGRAWDRRKKWRVVKDTFDETAGVVVQSVPNLQLKISFPRAILDRKRVDSRKLAISDSAFEPNAKFCICLQGLNVHRIAPRSPPNGSDGILQSERLPAWNGNSIKENG